MEREIKNKAASVRAKLMNIARAEKIDFDFLLWKIGTDTHFRYKGNKVLQYNKRCSRINKTRVRQGNV